MDPAQETMARLRRRARLVRLAGAILEGLIGLVVGSFLWRGAWGDVTWSQLEVGLAGWDWVLLLLLPLLEPAASVSYLGSLFLGLEGQAAQAFTVVVFAVWGWLLFGAFWFIAIHILDLDRELPHARRRWGARIGRWRGRGGD